MFEIPASVFALQICSSPAQALMGHKSKTEMQSPERRERWHHAHSRSRLLPHEKESTSDEIKTPCFHQATYFMVLILENLSCLRVSRLRRLVAITFSGRYNGDDVNSVYTNQVGARF